MLIRCFVCAMTPRAGTHERMRHACIQCNRGCVEFKMNGAYPFCANHSVRLLLLARISRVQLIVGGSGRRLHTARDKLLRYEDLFITRRINLLGASREELGVIVITDYLKGGIENTLVSRVIGKCFLVIQAESFKIVSRCPPDGCTYRFFEITQLVKRLSHGK